uniref:Uncharacterized protein n=2 Tax=Timema TaxID=61471 RepID=A0A7R9EHF0_9NEOP|nr:unnamed protein product [Timema monikensis]
MFAGLKNKIKEETGSDPTKLVSPAQKVVTPTNRGRHSRQGSGSSVGSISLDGAREELVSSPTHLKRQDSSELKLPDGKVVGSKDAKRLKWRRRLTQRDEEWGRRLDKKEEEFQKQLQEQKEEWKTTLDVLEREKSVLEEEKLEIVKQKLALEEALRASDGWSRSVKHVYLAFSEYKKKVFQYQEDLDQLEGFQTQEMAKIKHLSSPPDDLLRQTDGDEARPGAHHYALFLNVRHFTNSLRLPEPQPRPPPLSLLFIRSNSHIRPRPTRYDALLVKEQEVAERVNTLKESSSQIEQLKSEVNRLRRYEEEYSNLQVSLSLLVDSPIMGTFTWAGAFSVTCGLVLSPSRVGWCFLRHVWAGAFSVTCGLVLSPSCVGWCFLRHVWAGAFSVMCGLVLSPSRVGWCFLRHVWAGDFSVTCGLVLSLSCVGWCSLCHVWAGDFSVMCGLVLSQSCVGW